MHWQRIIYLLHYYDQPRSGIAFDPAGSVYFECQFDDAGDDWTNEHCLCPLDGELLKLLAEKQRISSRLWRADRQGILDPRGFPLAADRARDEEIWYLLQASVRDGKCASRVVGQFRFSEPSRGISANWEVKWMPVRGHRNA